MNNEEKILAVLEQIRDKLCPQPVTVIPISHSKDDRFVRNSDGTVKDSLLNLIWYPTLSKKFTWVEANEECKKMGCRLPTRRELESLLDLTKHDPAIDKEIFPDTKTDDYYWTSTPCAWDSGCAWVVYFYYGGVHSYNKGYHSCVRPVRSSQ